VQIKVSKTRGNRKGTADKQRKTASDRQDIKLPIRARRYARFRKKQKPLQLDEREWLCRDLLINRLLIADAY
jgi:hypothetical protein